MVDVTCDQYPDGYWVYDAALDCPRNATPKDMAELKTRVSALTLERILIRDILSLNPGNADSHWNRIKKLREAIAPILKEYQNA